MAQKKKSIGFSLLKVSTEQFAIIEDGFKENGKIRISTAIRFGADEKQKLIAVFTSFIYDSNQKPFIIIEAGCHFKITDSAWNEMYNIDNNCLRIPRGFLGHLTMLTIGTTRGILHSKTEGTCFNKYVLPTINVSEIIKEDTIFSFNVTKEKMKS
jgi:hypothetical protein